MAVLESSRDRGFEYEAGWVCSSCSVAVRFGGNDSTCHICGSERRRCTVRVHRRWGMVSRVEQARPDDQGYVWIWGLRLKAADVELHEDNEGLTLVFHECHIGERLTVRLWRPAMAEDAGIARMLLEVEDG